MTSYDNTQPHSPRPSTRDPRLSFAVGSGAWRLATVDEHARAGGMGVDEFLDALEWYLEEGWMRIEAHDGTLFLDTAANGEAGPGVATNLWSGLRRNLDVGNAALRWQRIRSLENAGWRVEMRPSPLAARFGDLRPLPWCAVDVQGKLVGLTWEPTGHQISGIDGICDTYAAAGEALTVVTCAGGELDDTVAAVRTWVLERGAVAGGAWLSVLILEAPSFGATLVRCSDNSVEPVAFATSERGMHP